MDEKKHWINKTKYIENKPGYYIAAEQENINEQKNSFVVATQIFLIKIDENKHAIYDAFIYFKELPKIENNIKPLIKL